MRKNCAIVRDLIPMYVEDLTSEESNEFIAEHLMSCEDCTKHLENVNRDLPKNDSLDRDVNDDQKLIKGIKFSIYKTVLTAILIGVLVGIFASMMFFNTNGFQALFVFYPIITFLIGLLSFILLKKIWIGPLVTFLGGLISSVVFLNITIWIWVIVYTVVSLIGSLVGIGIEKIKYSKVKISLRVLISITGILIALFSFLVLSFIMAMTPNKSEENKVIEQAEEYLEENYEESNFEIYDVLYDNMGNFYQFEYAAKVRDVDTGEEFLVYYNDQTKQMEDSLKYADEFY